MTNKKVKTFEKKIMHVRKNSADGISIPGIDRDYTVVALFDPVAKTIQYGVALCHPKADVFSKRYGRTLASLRALQTPLVVEDISHILSLQKDQAGKRVNAIFRRKAESFAYFFVPSYLCLAPEYK